MMCVCASGCDENPAADRGVFPPCACWCHQRGRAWHVCSETCRCGESIVWEVERRILDTLRQHDAKGTDGQQ